MRQKCGFNVPVVISILALIVAVWSQYNAGRSADAAEDARDAVRLELRAWLGYREITLAARRGTDGSWEDREPMQGDYGRIRLFVANTGKTPAANVRFLHQTPMLLRDSAELEPPEPSESEWETSDLEHVVVPGTEERFQDVQFRLNRQARVRQLGRTCCLSGFAWSTATWLTEPTGPKLGVMHHYGEPRDDFWTLSQSISPADYGKPDYERCPRTELSEATLMAETGAGAGC